MSLKGEKTKQDIREKAYQLFAEKGFKAVTMKDICELTGLSRGGLYRHYESTVGLKDNYWTSIFPYFFSNSATCRFISSSISLFADLALYSATKQSFFSSSGSALTVNFEILSAMRKFLLPF